MAVLNEGHNLIRKEQQLFDVVQRVALAVAAMLEQRLLYEVLKV